MSRFRAPRGRRSDWLALGEASSLLGVSAGTLRRWSDDGRVPVFTTPGGHRRFSRPALERLLPRDRAAGGLAPASLRAGITPSRLVRAYRREAPETSRVVPWIAGLEPADRETFRGHGRRIAELLIGHLDPVAAADVEHALREAAAEAAAYGRTAAALGLSLGQAVEGFLQFRRPFLHELAAVARRRGLDATGTGALLERAERALDRLLVATIAGHSVESVAEPGSAGVAGPAPARRVT